MSIDRVLEMYEEAFRRHGDSPGAVLWPKGRQDARFHALTRHVEASTAFSILDYGCGLAHLKPFLDARFPGAAYTGADAVPSFVEACRAKYPTASFYCVRSPEDVPGQFDYVVSSGTFNIRYGSDDDGYRGLVFRMLTRLFEKARVHLSVDFMTDAVDYRQPGAYHQNADELYRFVRGNLSRRLVLDQSYLPYEYAITIWKDQRIRRPDNVYE